MDNEWLIGETGLYRGSPQGGWTQAGAYAYCINGIAQLDSGLVLGSESGCWLAPAEGRWVQWHDETLTGVMAIAAAPVGAGVVVASAFGVATAEETEAGALRWRWHSDGLPVNARYSNAVLADPSDPLRWLVGTEAGVLVREHEHDRWVYSSLSRIPVRALCFAADTFWAGTDGEGIWRSNDGVSWRRAGKRLDDATVYALAWTGDSLLAGLEGGLAVGDGVARGGWRRHGPSLRVRSVGASDGVWLAGANPGGLWWSDDRGTRWRRSGFHSVRTIARRASA